MSTPLPALEIPPFTFRVDEQALDDYRHALGMQGPHVPLGIVMRTLLADTVAEALRGVLQGRYPVHVAQTYRVSRPLGVGIDYRCSIRLHPLGDSQFRVEQQLSDPAGHCCLIVASDIMLVDPVETR